jgi:hypothetical protein
MAASRKYSPRVTILLVDHLKTIYLDKKRAIRRSGRTGISIQVVTHRQLPNGRLLGSYPRPLRRISLIAELSFADDARSRGRRNF